MNTEPPLGSRHHVDKCRDPSGGCRRGSATPPAFLLGHLSGGCIPRHWFAVALRAYGLFEKVSVAAALWDAYVQRVLAVHCERGRRPSRNLPVPSRRLSADLHPLALRRRPSRVRQWEGFVRDVGKLDHRVGFEPTTLGKCWHRCSTSLSYLRNREPREGLEPYPTDVRRGVPRRRIIG
jgi:hypothetical protein